MAIRYSPEATASAPTRLYLKAQANALHKSAGGREVDFYRSVAAQMPYPPAPICFDAAHDPESGAYHLLLEDVSETHQPVHPEEPVTERDMGRILEALARLHAHWWGHAQLGRSVGTLPTPEAIRTDFDQLTKVFPEYVAFLGDRLST